MCQAPGGHQRPAAGNNTGGTAHRERDVLQENAEGISPAYNLGTLLK
jgi:hypothetical protein